MPGYSACASAASTFSLVPAQGDLPSVANIYLPAIALIIGSNKSSSDLIKSLNSSLKFGSVPQKSQLICINPRLFSGLSGVPVLCALAIPLDSCDIVLTAQS